MALAWFSWLSRPKQPFRDLRPEEIERVYAYYGGFLPEELEAGETAALLDILREATLYEPRIILFGYGGTFTYTQEPMFRLFLSDGTQLEVDVDLPDPILEWNGALYRTDREIRDRLKALYVERIEDMSWSSTSIFDLAGLPILRQCGAVPLELRISSTGPCRIRRAWQASEE